MAEIVGWKLKKDCQRHEQAAARIALNSSIHDKLETYNDNLYHVIHESNGYYRLKKTGVLYLYF